MPKAARVYDDGRTHRVAVGFTSLLLEEIADQRVRHDRDHHQARDRALRQFAGEMVRQGGQDAADMAVRAVHTLSPDECLTKRELDVLRARQRTEMLDLVTTYRPAASTRLNRFWIRLTGMALY